MYANAYPENGDGTNTKFVAPEIKSPESNIPAPEPNSPTSDAKSFLRGRDRRRYPMDFMFNGCSPYEGRGF